MGRLHTIGRIIITVYPNDHLPPHFHVVAPDFEALIDIETLTLIVGALPPKARRVVLPWVEENRAVIVDEWNRINPRFPAA